MADLHSLNFSGSRCKNICRLATLRITEYTKSLNNFAGLRDDAKILVSKFGEDASWARLEPVSESTRQEASREVNAIEKKFLLKTRNASRKMRDILSLATEITNICQENKNVVPTKSYLDKFRQFNETIEELNMIFILVNKDIKDIRRINSLRD